MLAKKRIGCVGALLLAMAIFTAEPAVGETIVLAPDSQRRDVWFRKTVDLPDQPVRRAWALVSAEHEFTLYVNGREAGRSGYGRVASSFRLREELFNLAAHLKPGRNVIAAKIHRWSPGRATFCFECEVQLGRDETIVKVPIVSDAIWRGSDRVTSGWNKRVFDDSQWRKVATVNGQRSRDRVGKTLRDTLTPPAPPPLPKSLLTRFPALAQMSDWSQQVVYRDPSVVRLRLMKVYHTPFVVERLTEQLCNPNTRMGDSFSISGVSIGNGIVWTSMGRYPFTDTGYLLGPEYQMPLQWNPASAFSGTSVRLLVDGKDASPKNQWLWKIRQTDVVVTASAAPHKTSAGAAIAGRSSKRSAA